MKVEHAWTYRKTKDENRKIGEGSERKDEEQSCREGDRLVVIMRRERERERERESVI